MENVWIAILGSLNVAGLVAVVSTLLNLGKLWRTVEENTSTIVVMAGKLELFRSELERHKLNVAENYTTNADLRNSIEQVTKVLDRLDKRFEDYVYGLAKKND